MWQDGLALFIVVIAVLAMLRIYAPVGMLRFGARRGSDSPVKNAASASGCGGCAAGASCSKVPIKAHLGAIQRHERLSSDNHLLTP